MNKMKLTEEMVVARTKISDLSKVKKLNCWGSELMDISLVKRMPNVEVLSLSVNKINNLSDFQHCRHLQELYVRQNKIKDLNQVCYLQNLPNLKHLWLSENPCADAEGYRLSVIRALPQLQKLDNLPVQLEELSDALKRGRLLAHPDDEPEPEPEPPVQAAPHDWAPAYRHNSYDNYYQSPDRSPPRQESPPRRQPEVRRSYSPEPDPTPVYYEDRRNANSFDQESPKHQQYYDEYTNGDRHYHQPMQYKQEGGSDGSNHSHSGYDSARLRERERCDKTICPANHRPPFNRRPVTRNSSILSAVLCLVKELDYASLEVVEMAVRCRMDELDE